MKIIVVPRFCHDDRHPLRTLVLSGLLLIATAALLAGGGVWFGYSMRQQVVQEEQPQEYTKEAFKSLLFRQREALDATRNQANQHLNVLALRLGTLQSHIMRLDALGERLVTQAELDAQEFSFDQPPARGGIESAISVEREPNELLNEMVKLSRIIEDREHKLTIIEGLLSDDQVKSDLTLAGRPVRWGWISSQYGYRQDPFTGKKAFHHGVDIAGKADSDVIAVASGVVAFAGKKSSYGYLVEILHAGGYSTKYGHNSKIMVKAGDIVTKGEVIGLMGSSGRSTGPHVHFEVVRKGRSLNPSKFLRRKS
ncbi:MAG: M23 family metallopeptidase [Gammaproteobacteria bacterium]|nr:M23 family metallopeptidase [Gammaproteobacteria bacterium]